MTIAMTTDDFALIMAIWFLVVVLIIWFLSRVPKDDDDDRG